MNVICTVVFTESPLYFTLWVSQQKTRYRTIASTEQTKAYLDRYYSESLMYHSESQLGLEW